MANRADRPRRDSALVNDMLEPQYDQLEQRVISVRTITIVSGFDGSAMDGESYRNRLSGKYSHRVLTGVGHLGELHHRLFDRSQDRTGGVACADRDPHAAVREMAELKTGRVEHVVPRRSPQGARKCGQPPGVAWPCF